MLRTPSDTESRPGRLRSLVGLVLGLAAGFWYGLIDAPVLASIWVPTPSLASFGSAFLAHLTAASILQPITKTSTDLMGLKVLPWFIPGFAAAVLRVIESQAPISQLAGAMPNMFVPLVLDIVAFATAPAIVIGICTFASGYRSGQLHHKLPIIVPDPVSMLALVLGICVVFVGLIMHGLGQEMPGYLSALLAAPVLYVVGAQGAPNASILKLILAFTFLLAFAVLPRFMLPRQKT